MDQKMQECIANCSNCHDVCLQTINYCLDKGGEYAAPDNIRTLMDCVQICQTSKDFMVRNSDSHPRACGACSEVCRKCSEFCEQFSDDKQMQKCAEICRRCAKTCAEMSSTQA